MPFLHFVQSPGPWGFDNEDATVGYALVSERSWIAAALGVLIRHTVVDCC
eukprot:NODE_17464_length_296_cov_5.234818_g16296_i0.p2 GENE.NODE_17464_length_296_cov_5.234818_g16296_i0~~NODE_17464_length_296_cov_5.234818_g16296_i0.p2  ORF type:complete len:50 (-),score=2.83 NODE_17464_length_296_cov_5.234818_g16296_i0:93-242(-)